MAKEESEQNELPKLGEFSNVYLLKEIIPDLSSLKAKPLKLFGHSQHSENDFGGIG
jgi:hypothetical protein